MLFILVLCFSFTEVFAINCMQCNGWHGSYPASHAQVSTCDNRNNQCSTPQFCVKMIDTMEPGVNYATYKSDCFYQTQLQVNPQNLTFVQGRACYPFQDGSTPVKRWAYCFCNDRDYCNSQASLTTTLSILLSVITYFYIC